MRKSSFYLLLLVIVLAASCIKDRTNINLTPISSITIDTVGLAESFTVYQLDTLKVNPKVIKGGFNVDNLKYEWTMNDYGGYKRIIGTQRELQGVVTDAPSSRQYTLILTVTDTATGQKGFYTWPVSVFSRLGEGLLVADTKDGVNSDVSLVMARNFTANISDETATKIHRNLYSSVNEGPINGLIKGISYVNNTNNKSLTFITDNSFIRVDPTSYKSTIKDNGLFIIAPDVIKPDVIQPLNLKNQHEYMINDGKVYSRYGTNPQFVYPFLSDPKGYICKQICGLQDNSSPGGASYDELNNRFMLLPSISSNSTPFTIIPPVDNSGTAPAFDPNNIGNKTCLFMQEGVNKRILSVMKTRDQNQYYAYQLISVNPVNGKMGYSMHDLSGNAEIDQAKFYATSTGEQVLFYATDSKVYSSTLLVGGSTNVNIRYTVPAGEKITGMQMHIRNGNTYLPSLSNPSNYAERRSVLSSNRLLLVSTYNESTKEGKIVAIPLETLGVGGLATDAAYIQIYGGFNKITAFNFQGT